MAASSRLEVLLRRYFIQAKLVSCSAPVFPLHFHPGLILTSPTCRIVEDFQQGVSEGVGGVALQCRLALYSCRGLGYLSEGMLNLKGDDRWTEP